jgi:hypothetical protein
MAVDHCVLDANGLGGAYDFLHSRNDRLTASGIHSQSVDLLGIFRVIRLDQASGGASPDGVERVDQLEDDLSRIHGETTILL